MPAPVYSPAIAIADEGTMPTVRLPSSSQVMNSAELKAAIAQLDVSDGAIARALHLGEAYDGGNGDRTVRRWKDGERPIPGPVATLLRLAVHSAAARELLEILPRPG